MQNIFSPLKRIFIICFLFFFTPSIFGKTVFCYNNYGAPGYLEEKEEFFQKIFKNYDVILVESLKNLKDFDYIITLEVPHKNDEFNALFSYPKEKVLLFSFEGQITHPRSHDYVFHAPYSKIFTWNDNFIDNQRYFKVLFPWADPLPMIPNDMPFEQKKLCVLVSSENWYNHPLENYSGRADIINFFEKINESDFNFYGKWSKPYSSYKNYKGVIPWEGTLNYTYSRRMNKINVIKNYKFDICYENTKGFYLTERIFDSFAAGCVPIYWGAENIEKYIPKECFILRNQFKNNEELCRFIKTMSKETFQKYQESIKNFLDSEAARRLSTNYFIKKIREILCLSES